MNPPEEYYLLQEGPQTEEMVNYFEQMLSTAELTNIQLVLSIMEGGGLPERFYTHAFLLYQLFYYTPEHKDTAEQALRLLEKFLPPALQEDWLYPPAAKLEGNLSMLQLEKWATLENINKNIIGNFTLQLGFQVAAAFCLKYQTASEKDIINYLVHHGNLSLKDFKLADFPESICELESLQAIDISGNYFTSLPENISKLKNLTYIDFENTPLTPDQIVLLEQWLPEAMADYYIRQAEKILPTKLEYTPDKIEMYTQAISYMEKARPLAELEAEVWHKLGYLYCLLSKTEDTYGLKSQQALQKALEGWGANLQIVHNAYDLFQRSLTFALLDQKEESLKALQQSITINPNYKFTAQNAPEFILKRYHEQDDFKSLVY